MKEFKNKYGYFPAALVAVVSALIFIISKFFELLSEL
jgi:hypothetical protein